MLAFDSAKANIANAKSRLDRCSQNSYRSSSPARTFVMRSNADSMKPSTLTYNSATLVNVADHLRRVDDCMQNRYPSGYSFALFKSNFNSTIDEEFSCKALHFDRCKSENEVKEEAESIMEIKFPIHTCCMACIKPVLKSNKVASSFFSQVELDFENSKM